MAIKQIGKASQLAFTQVGSGGPTGPLTAIQSYGFNEDPELEAFLNGGARVNTHYEGTMTGTLTVVTADLGKALLFKKGQVYTNVILTVEAAKHSHGVAEGGNITVTMSKAVVASVGEVGKDNANAGPATREITFEPTRLAGDSSDPTIVVAEVV